MPVTQSAIDAFVARNNAFRVHWDATEEVSSHQMDEAADLARELLTLTVSPDATTPEQDRLVAAIRYWDSLDEHDLDAALDIVYAAEDIPVMSTSAAAGWLEEMKNGATTYELLALDVAIRALTQDTP